MKTLSAVIGWLGLSIFSVAAASFDIRDEAEFKKVISPDTKVEKVATGFHFTEGPVWVRRNGGFLVFSDIPANELKQWSAKEGITTFRKPSLEANGNTIDPKQNVLSCEHLGRKVVRADAKGNVAVVVDSFDGKKFNSPNDIVVKRDGTFWFTDPDYGLGKRQREMAGKFVFRFDPRSKQVTAVATDFDEPNGLCFSPDEKILYVADSGAPRHIRALDVRADGTLTNSRVFCKIDVGVPDGIRCDKKGRVWSSAGDGVQIFMPNGTLIGKILLPETAANLCFGGNDRPTLFITATTSLYAVEIAAQK
jgi:gluconolactonase